MEINIRDNVLRKGMRIEGWKLPVDLAKAPGR